MFEDRFKALGEPTRMKIIKLLSVREFSVCDLEEVMQISQPRISQHLKVLRHAGLVKERREGQRTICSLNVKVLDETIDNFMLFIKEPLESIEEFSDECARIAALDGQSCERKRNQKPQRIK